MDFTSSFNERFAMLVGCGPIAEPALTLGHLPCLSHRLQSMSAAVGSHELVPNGREPRTQGMNAWAIKVRGCG